MALKIQRTSPFKTRILSTLVLIFALMLQPLIALNVPAAFATTASIEKIAFMTVAQTISASETSGVITIQTQNNGGNAKQLDTPNNILSVSSTSSTGQFTGSVGGAWSAPGSFIMNSGTANRSFYYSDSTPGTYTLTATLSANGGAKILTNTQTVTVTAVTPTIEPVLTAQDFSTWDSMPSFKGFNVGFAAHNFGNVTSATIDVVRADGSHVERTAGPDILALLSNVTTPTSASAPFVIQPGTSNGLTGSSWWSAQTNMSWTTATKPTSVTITVVGANGTKSVTNPIFLEGDNSSHPAYASMLPQPYVAPSTNENNKTNGWAHVNEISKTTSSVTLEFKNPRSIVSCFEYRTDGDISQILTANGGNNYNSGVKDGLYPYFCQNGNSRTETINASQYVEVRMVFGGEDDERFDWTRFNVASHPDPSNSHQLTLSGLVFHNLNSDRDRDAGEDTLSNWTIRAYKEDSNGNWQSAGTANTRSSDNQYAIRQLEAGIYHVCLVNQSGWTQIRQNWDGTPYHLVTENQSGAADEGKWCSTVNYDDTKDSSNAKYFGVLDTQEPVGTAIYSGGIDLDGVRYVKSVDNLSFTETITDNHGVVRATYLVQKLNTNTHLYERFCGNWNARSSGNHALGSTVHEVYTVNSIKSCVSDASKWVDGTYKIFHAAYDQAGNEGKYNTNRQVFVIDSTVGVPTINTPSIGQYFNTASILNSWTAVTDESGIDHYQVAYIYKDGHTFNDGGLCSGVVIDGKAVSGCRDVTGTQRNHAPNSNEQGGVTIYVRAIDGVGNVGAWSLPVNYTYDATAPADTVLTSPANGAVVKGASITQSWSNASSDVDHYIYESYNDAGATSLRWHEEFTGTSKTATNVASATYWWRVKAVDHAGNVGAWSPLWKITVDNDAPAVPTGLKITTPLGSIFTTSGIGNATNEENGIFSWNEVSGAVGYNFYPWDDNGSYFTHVMPTTPVNGSSPYVGTSILGLWPDGEDTYHACITAVDAAGNESACSDTLTITYDVTAPHAPVASYTGNGTQTVTLATTDSTADIYYTIDGSTETRYTGPFTLTQGLGFSAVARDAAGNESDKLIVAAPIITEETSILATTTSLVLQWTTDMPTTSRVIYDTTSHNTLDDNDVNYGYAFSTVEDSNKVTGHSVTVTGLTPGTTYYFRTVSHGSPVAVSSEVSGTTNKVVSTGTLTDGTPIFQIVTNNNSVAQSLFGAGAPILGSIADGDAHKKGSDVLGKTDPAKDGTPLSGTEVLGAMDNKFFGVTWYWWLIVLAAVVGSWLLVAAAVRRRRYQEE